MTDPGTDRFIGDPAGSAAVCDFGPCTCVVEADGGHCAPTCRLGIGESGEPCKCGHAECKATNGSG